MANTPRNWRVCALMLKEEQGAPTGGTNESSRVSCMFGFPGATKCWLLEEAASMLHYRGEHRLGLQTERLGFNPNFGNLLLCDLGKLNKTLSPGFCNK